MWGSCPAIPLRMDASGCLLRSHHRSTPGSNSELPFRLWTEPFFGARFHSRPILVSPRGGGVSWLFFKARAKRPHRGAGHAGQKNQGGVQSFYCITGSRRVCLNFGGSGSRHVNGLLWLAKLAGLRLDKHLRKHNRRRYPPWLPPASSVSTSLSFPKAV